MVEFACETVRVALRVFAIWPDAWRLDLLVLHAADVGANCSKLLLNSRPPPLANALGRTIDYEYHVQPMRFNGKFSGSLPGRGR